MILYLCVNKLIVLITHCIFIFIHSYQLHFRPLNNGRILHIPLPQIACWIRPSSEPHKNNVFRMSNNLRLKTDLPQQWLRWTKAKSIALSISICTSTACFRMYFFWKIHFEGHSEELWAQCVMCLILLLTNFKWPSNLWAAGDNNICLLYTSRCV